MDCRSIWIWIYGYMDIYGVKREKRNIPVVALGDDGGHNWSGDGARAGDGQGSWLFFRLVFFLCIHLSFCIYISLDESYLSHGISLGAVGDGGWLRAVGGISRQHLSGNSTISRSRVLNRGNNRGDQSGRDSERETHFRRCFV